MRKVNFRQTSEYNTMVKTRLDLMPPLKQRDSEMYDISESEAVQGLLTRKDVQRLLFGIAKKSGLIEYDRDTKLWTGISYHACRKVADRGGSADEIAKARKVS